MSTPARPRSGARPLKRYDLFGWDYPLHCPLSRQEVAWHLGWARRTGGPLLTLACGTGRLVCRLVAAGFDVTGIDLSDTMLHLARSNVARLPAAARRRVRLIKADMTEFGLRRAFGMIFIADNSFREVRTRARMRSCLRCIQRHLTPTGRVLITERRFDPSLYRGGRRSFGWSQTFRHPKTGQRVCRRGEIRLSKDRRRVRTRFIYKTVDPSGIERIEVCPWSGPVLTKRQYLQLFQRAGFAVETHCGYREGPDDGKNPVLCFVCRRTEGVD